MTGGKSFKFESEQKTTGVKIFIFNLFSFHQKLKILLVTYWLFSFHLLAFFEEKRLHIN